MKVKLNGNDFFEMTADYGQTDWVHKTPHTGIDLAMNEGTKLFSPTDGVITKIVDYGDKNIGKGIIMKTEDGESLIMGHLSDTSMVKVGQHVEKGDLVALSGNTGRSTGGHLHLGLKDESGAYLDPDKYIGETSNKSGFFGLEKNIDTYKNPQTVDDRNMIQFLNDWRKEGFWEAMYDKPFFEVLKDFFGQLFKDLGIFILGNADLFFLLPAIVFMLGTFIVGKNKYSKWIIPLWFAYFVSTVFHKILSA